MILRRIREHVEKHNWFAVAIDLVIVIVGVFLGMQVNNWNEARAERAAAADYRRDIVADLKANELDLSSRNAYYRAVRSHAVATLEAVEMPARPRDERFLIDAYQASQVWSRPLTRAAYDEMIGAGLGRSIGDRELRSRLTTYYTQIRQFDVTALGVTSYRERLRRVLPYSVQDAIRQKCDDRVTTLRGGAQIAAFPEHCTLGLDGAAVAGASAKLSAADLGEDLTRQIADLDQKIAGFERFGKLARELRMRLESAN